MEHSDIEDTQKHSVGGEDLPEQANTEVKQPQEDDPIHTGDEQTRPVSLAITKDEPGDQPPTATQLGASLRFPAWRWLILLSFSALVIIAGASAFGGYRSGIFQRTSLEATQMAMQVNEQFQLGLQDLEAGKYEVARQRFEYVIQLDPDYPGVTEKLAEVLLELNTTATPTTAPTPTLTPTVDLRGAEELFSQAQLLLADKKWSEGIDTLLQLRKEEPDYRPVKVDAMLYVALRNRGADKILNQADLEGGTYDLALAERFGPLDVEAANYRTWADLYVTGASFWELDWGQAANYFGQLLLVAPNLRDSSNMTVTERFRIAAIKYGDLLAENGDWCQAQEQFEAALNFGSDPAVEPTASWVTRECAEASEPEQREEEPTPLPEPQITPSPGVTPELTPTQEPYPPPTP